MHSRALLDARGEEPRGLDVHPSHVTLLCTHATAVLDWLFMLIAYGVFDDSS